jgi:hypothetical protein
MINAFLVGQTAIHRRALSLQFGAMRRLSEKLRDPIR